MSNPNAQLRPPIAGTHQGPPFYPGQQVPPFSPGPQVPPFYPGPQRPPFSPGPPGPPARSVDQRPLVVSLAVCMSTTAAMLFLCAFGFIWMMALAIRESFDYSMPAEGVLFHMAERFHLSLIQGLVLPIVAFPVLTVVAGFMLLIRRAWTRLVYSVLGIAALGWSSYWLAADLRMWAPAAVYIVFCILIVWHRSATTWYGRSVGK